MARDLQRKPRPHTRRPRPSRLRQQRLDFAADAGVVFAAVEVGQEFAAIEFHGPPQRPSRVSADQRALVVEQLNQMGDGGFVPPVAGGDASVAHQPLALDALNRRPPEHGLEGVVVGHQNIGEFGRDAVHVKGQEGDFVGFFGEALEGADVLADIAAEDPVAELPAQVTVDPALVLDGVIADAQARIQDEGGGKGIGRAGLQAARTGPAHALAMGLVVIVEFQGTEDLADEEIAAAPRVDQHGIFADETHAGLLGVAALEDGAGIDVDLLRDLVPSFGCQPLGELPQPQFQHAMVVQSPGVGGDAPARGIVEDFIVGIARVIVHPDQDQRLGLRQDYSGVLPPPQAVRPRHVAHFALHALLDPAQVCRQRRRWFRGCHAAEVESELLRFSS